MIIGYFHSKYFHDAVEALPPSTHFIRTGGDDFQYWNELKARWTGMNDLMVVEQDIVITPGIIEGFKACPGLWCVYPYGGLKRSLGCVRFRKELQNSVWIESVPDSLVQPAKMLPVPSDLPSSRNLACEKCTMHSVCWRHLDLRVAGALMEKGFDSCVHSPDVRHMH